MGKKDLYQSDFYENERRFADVFNGALFGGREVIKPEELEEADGQLASILQDGKAAKVIRDKVKRWRGGHLVILVAESQTHVDYGMVFRVMKAEALGYERQRKKAFERARADGESFDDHEFLSRMKKEWKFAPIITLVLYFGKDRLWDGARSLRELVDAEEDLKELVSDYRIHVYDYHEHEDFGVFRTENRVLFEVLSCGNNRERLIDVLEQPVNCGNLDRESAKMIRGITELDFKLEDIVRFDEESKEEAYDVCKAIREYREDCIREGELRGRVEDLRNLMKNLSITLERAMELLEIPLEEKEKYQPLA